MRILYHFRTQGTGAEGVHIAGMANACEQLGHQVEFCSPGGHDPRAGAGENPFARSGGRRAGWRWLARAAKGPLFELLELGYNLAAFLRLRRRLAQGGIDLLYERHAFFLFATALVARAYGLPLVVEVNELAGDERVRASPLLLPVARWSDAVVFRHAARIIVVSPHLGRRLEAAGVPAAKIVVLPNAVDAALLERVLKPAAIRARYGLEGMLTAGFVGWFVPWHRLDRLIEAFATLAREEPRLRLLLVGDGPLRLELAAQAEGLGVKDQVLLPGAVPHSEIPDVLAAMEVSIVPHGNDFRSPLKLFEAMAVGTAVLAPAVEPIQAVLEHERNALLFNPEDPADLRENLRRLLGDPSLRRSLAKKARENVGLRHTWKHNAVAALKGLGRK